MLRCKRVRLRVQSQVVNHIRKERARNSTRIRDNPHQTPIGHSQCLCTVGERFDEPQVRTTYGRRLERRKRRDKSHPPSPQRGVKFRPKIQEGAGGRDGRGKDRREGTSTRLLNLMLIKVYVCVCVSDHVGSVPIVRSPNCTAIRCWREREICTYLTERSCSR